MALISALLDQFWWFLWLVSILQLCWWISWWPELSGCHFHGCKSFEPMKKPWAKFFSSLNFCNGHNFGLSGWNCLIFLANIVISFTMRALSKADLRPSKANMRGAASLWKEKQTLSLPPTCTQLVLCEKGKFSLDGSFSKNTPYKQKIMFHWRIIDKMSWIFFGLEGRAVVATAHGLPK